MDDLVGVLRVIEDYIPRDLTELYLVEAAFMLLFGFMAFVAGVIHHHRFDLYRVLRNGISAGAAFPASLLLILYPFSDRARALFGTDALKGYLMIAGAYGAVLSLYGTFKK